MFRIVAAASLAAIAMSHAPLAAAIDPPPAYDDRDEDGRFDADVERDRYNGALDDRADASEAARDARLQYERDRDQYYRDREAYERSREAYYRSRDAWERDRRYAAAPPPPPPAPYEGETWRGDDGRTYCRKSDGTTGLLVGGVGGALIGRAIDGGRRSAVGTILGAGAGALIGRSVEQNATCK